MYSINSYFPNRDRLHEINLVFSEITVVHDLVPVHLSVSIGISSHGVRSRFIGFTLPVQ